MTGTKTVGMDIGIVGPVDICLAKHDRRLRLYDERLLRPKTVTFMVALARRFVRARGSTPAPA